MTVDRVADCLVPDPQVEREFSITSMTLWRWTRDPTFGFPEKISIRGRNYRSRRQLDDFKAKLLAQALKSKMALTDAARSNSI